MAKKDPRVDAYIGKSAEFERPILKHLPKVNPQGNRSDFFRRRAERKSRFA